MAGRKPKPTALKLLTGNPGGRPLNKREPKPKSGSAPCPPWLCKEAKAKWKHLQGILRDMGLLTVADYDAMVTYCQAWAMFREASEAVGETGTTFMTPKGYIAKHPGVTIINETTATMHKIGCQFGLTPSARTRLTTDKPVDDADDVADFLGLNKRKA